MCVCCAAVVQRGPWCSLTLAVTGRKVGNRNKTGPQSAESLLGLQRARQRGRTLDGRRLHTGRRHLVCSLTALFGLTQTLTFDRLFNRRQRCECNRHKTSPVQPVPVNFSHLIQPARILRFIQNHRGAAFHECNKSHRCDPSVVKLTLTSSLNLHLTPVFRYFGGVNHLADFPFLFTLSENHRGPGCLA